MQASAFFLHLPDVTVDALMADGMLPKPGRFSLHPTRDGIGTLAITELVHDVTQQPWIVMPAFSLRIRSLSPFLGTALSCSGGVPIPVGRRTGALHLSANGRLVTAEDVCHLLLGMSVVGFEQCLELLPLRAGKMCHTVGWERVLKPSLLPYFSRGTFQDRYFLCISLLNSGTTNFAHH